jgi:hypothetical protein
MMSPFTADRPTCPRSPRRPAPRALALAPSAPGRRAAAAAIEGALAAAIAALLCAGLAALVLRLL